MSYFWRKVSFCLLLVGTAGSALGQYSSLDKALGKASGNSAERLREVGKDDPEAVDAAQRGNTYARDYIRLRAELEGAPATPEITPPKGVSDDRTEASWLSRALSRLRNLFDQDEKPSTGSLPNLNFGWLTTLVWVVLGAVLLGLVYLLVRTVNWKLPKRKPLSQSDEEAERTVDMWLFDADEMQRTGQFREAVRSLYIAGLMRLDEAEIARFDLRQTNWEHLRRIEASPKRPADLDVRGPTLAFDRIWYGMQSGTDGDVDAMRRWYLETAKLTTTERAA